MMRITPTYSETADTAYLSFGEARSVAKTIAPMDDLAIDLDDEGRIVGIEFVTASRLLDDTTLVDAELDELIGVTEIARLLGKRKQNVTQYYTLRDDFPSPAAELPTGRYWRRGDVDAWITREQNQRRQQTAAVALAGAAEWLTHALRAGARSTAELRRAAAERGLNWASVRRAASAIDVERARDGVRMLWSLPSEHPTRRRKAEK